ncbi:MAG TPA: ATP-grasp domain-containing protein [Lacipirellulaceae bacterium]|nr:ATP-grasp domain-containing protein [Lacipirellulaceae bacterium]
MAMHFFVYEWATGGGLVDEPGPLPASLLREGTAMIGAVVADLVRIPDCKVSALRDPRVLHLALPGCNVVDVICRTSQRDEFERLAGEADATILIAPEFDGILLKLARMVTASGGQLLSPSPEFIRIAADKQRTCEAMAAAGVPVPIGRALESDEPLPADFAYPAVLKPIDGAGSQDTYIVNSQFDAPPAYAWRRRLERYLPGLPTSVAVLCGPACRLPLVPCKQRISEDGRLRYLGGELPLAAGLAERARRITERALEAMPPVTGYVGMDMVLGREPDGSEDALIEINPRLTTSYVGLRAAANGNLAETMSRIANGEMCTIEFSNQAIEFDASGNVSYLR